MTTGGIAVTVVAGGSRTGKSRLIGQLRANRPGGQRWAFLNNSLAGGAEPGRLAAGGSSLPARDYFHVAGGCACCLAGPAFRTAMVRLLRADSWQHLHIEVDPAGHPHALVDQLRTPPFDQYLTVTHLLLTLDEKEHSVYRGEGPGPGPGPGRLDWATDFLLGGIRTDATASFADFLESAPPWPRLERVECRLATMGPSGLPAQLPGWRVFSALEPGAGPGGYDMVRQWPAASVAARRPLRQLLSELAAEPGVAGFQALMRTPRAWYRWRFGRGIGAGSLAFDEGPQVVESETFWRLDSRLCVWLGPDDARRPAIQGRLAALDQAVQGSRLEDAL